jgi:tetratricopeptide (TPR) repeat protein
MCKFGMCTFIAAFFLGCATAHNSQPETLYRSKLPPGIETLDAAKKDLAALLNTRRNPIGIKYYGQEGINLYANVAQLSALMKGSKAIHRYYNGSANELLYVLVTGITVRDDRLEVSPRMALFYDDLADHPIVVEMSRDYVGYFYFVKFPDQISFHFHKNDLPDAQRFADDLFFIQQTMKKREDERRASFESKAAQYRALTIKPPVSEEQRKYIVQANAANQQKDYSGAIEMYRKALDVDPTSYPGAYFNLALLSAQMKRFNPAISYMKQYLSLVPDAADARSAQDKIYEWEFMIQQKG